MLKDNTHHSDNSEIIEYQQKVIIQKDDDIKSLNREIGALKQQLNMFRESSVLYRTEHAPAMKAAESDVEFQKTNK